jgi:hypothetical protein
MCWKHGGGKPCTEKDCTNAAVDSSGKCRTHGGGPRCEVCDKPAWDSQKKRCMLHGGGPRCKSCSYTCANPYYEGYCAACFKRLFPTHEKSKIIYEHKKEIIVRNMLVEKFDGFVHDKVMVIPNCDCTHRRRIDFRKQIGNTILAIEVDEDGHRYYDPKNEEDRYNDLYMAFSAKWIYIRFNPDGKGVNMDDKLSRLAEEISRQIQRIENEENSKPVDIIPLFLD